jgi:hypothetical protein
MTRVQSLPLDAATYQRHALHAETAVWVEKNCYIDVWIELVHAVGCDPMAMLPFVASVDFEDDQWTFFKPKHEELWDLYGIDIQELNVWRPLAEHVRVHVGAGKVIATEADAFWLPDTQGTDYQRQHTKTTIIIADFDLEKRRLGYFHNASYYALEGTDFEKLFRIGAPPDPEFQPHYAEVVRVDQLVKRRKEELVTMSRALLKKHVARRPKDNPVKRFGDRITADLTIAVYHAWAFATIRQLGASMELLSHHLKWRGDASDEEAAAAFAKVSDGAKTLILKGARSVNGKKPLDAKALFDEMTAAYERGIALIAI